YILTYVFRYIFLFVVLFFYFMYFARFYTLSLHDSLPILVLARWLLRECKVLMLDEPTRGVDVGARSEIYTLIRQLADDGVAVVVDRKSTRLNSSHVKISYAVFCLKKKKRTIKKQSYKMII